MNNSEAEQAAPKALVTGAAGGLGRAISVELAKNGYDLVLADKDAEGMVETRALCDASEATCVVVELDLSEEASIRACVAKGVDALGGLTLLVNNAGVALHKPATDLTWNDWDFVLDVNLKGAFFMSQSFAARALESQTAASIVNVGSTHGIVGVSERAAYGISKAGIMHMTRMLAIEWAERGIRVNAVAPGTIMTPSRELLLRDPKKRQGMLDRIPMKNFPEADEIAAAVAYLASPSARSITGHTLVVDGGTTVI